ncbi:MAG: RHS repeat-associated protein [Planctomycetota bacterium]|jgi:RHS repeat-associated protein
MTFPRITQFILSIAFLLTPGLAQNLGSSQGAPNPTRTPIPQAGLPGELVTRVMPGYPNAPHYTPDERKLVLEGRPTLIWGNASIENGSAIGETYTWTFGNNPNVEISVGGNLVLGGSVAGTITNEKFIYELMTFSLVAPSTSEILLATLRVDLAGGESAERMVEMVIFSESDPLIDEPLERMQFDVNIAVDEALRYMYLNQLAAGDWDGSNPNGYASQTKVAATGFSMWAFQNIGHLSSNNDGEDIYADTVKLGMKRIFSEARVMSAGTHARADSAFGATVPGECDQNGNGTMIRLASSSYARRGYTMPMLCSAIVASTLPNELVNIQVSGQTGVYQSMSYREVVQDSLDYLAYVMNQGANSPSGTNGSTYGGRGGWIYEPNKTSGTSDMSINSWYFVACEGAETVFGVDVPYWFKREIEYELVAHQPSSGGHAGFRYRYNSTSRMATTGGGLSALRLLETTSFPGNPPGMVMVEQGMMQSGEIGAAGQEIAGKRLSALGFLGDNWNQSGMTHWASVGNRGNPYIMWTVARALRLTADSELPGLNLPVHLIHNGVEFDWETGLEVDTGIIPGPGDAREGYFPYALRNQVNQSNSSSIFTWGSWPSSYGVSMATALYTLVLNPKVFALPCQVTASQVFADLSPVNGTTLPAGSEVVLNGRITPDGTGLDITAVFVDGVAVDSLDVAGNFFKEVTIQEGANIFEILVIQPCGDVETQITIWGEVEGEVNFNQYQSVSFQTDVQYANTTWLPADHILQVDVTACNVGETAILGPLLMVFETFLNGGVELLEPDGFTPEGQPFVIFGSSLEDPDFAGGDCSLSRQLRFHSPAEQPINFTLEWLSPNNQAPIFTTVPKTTEVAGQVYAYQAHADDINGHEVIYSPVYGPPGMTVDQGTGLVLWSTQSVDLGGHAIGIRAEDGFGGETVQEFVVTLVESITNRPPYFASAPPTHAPIGVAFEYQALGIDPDQDQIQFNLIYGPAGMQVSTTGFLTWDLPLPGDVAVRVAVTDGNGGGAEQAWVLTVGNQSTDAHAPVLYGTPSGVAVLGDPYTYQPVAYDLDADDVLTFRLLESPPGMTVETFTGFVRWTPASSGLGEHIIELEVDDNNGGTATQSWPMEVFTDAPNRAPVIQSIPSLVGVVGEPYTYQAVAIDPDEDVITYHLVAPPTGMTIDEQTGLVNWLPSTANQYGVAIQAIDIHGAAGSQVFTVHVIPPNAAPVVTSTPSASVTVGMLWSYPVQATDAENHTLAYTLAVAPEGMTIHSQVGYASWRPALDQLGDHDVEINVHDGFGGVASQPFTMTVVPDVEAPTVYLSVTPNPAVVGEGVEICVLAGDNVGVTEYSLLIDGVLQQLDATHCITIAPMEVASLELRGEASDEAGNLGSQDFVLEVLDSATPQPGDITLHSPSPGEIITRPTPVVASIAGGTANQPIAISWSVQIRAAESQGTWKVIAEGLDVVDNDQVALFDPTLLRNGSWIVQVLASVDNGPQNGVEFSLEVAGDFKLGQFEMTLTDLVVPVAGISMVVSRQYSSLSDESGDFGPGWRLALPGDVADGPKEGTNETFNIGTRVYVTRADGIRVGFTTRFTPLSWIFPFLGTVSFDPDTGVYDSLRATDSPVLTLAGGLIYQDLFATPYNPDEYVLETSSGVSYTMHELDGLRLVEDIFGNTIDVTPGGLISSTGVSIQFQRDSQGRITRIIEPTGSGATHWIDFTYDELTGNLLSSTDRDGAVTQYIYDVPTFPHYLSEVLDPLGRAMVRNVIDEEGRLIAQCGPDGNIQTLAGCLQFNLDINSSIQTIIDGRGYESTLELDEAGRILRGIVYDDEGMPLVTERTYDEAGNITSVTDADSNKATYTYDQDGNLTSSLSPAGILTQSEYETGTHRLLLQSDGLGNISTFVYDEDGRLLESNNALGGQTLYGYDQSGHLRSITDALGAVWSFDYDASGYPALMTDPRGATAQVSYNYLGRLIAQTDRDGRRIEFEYDAEGRLLKETWVAGTNIVHNYSYDAAGRLTSAIGPDGSFELDYWNDGNLKSALNTANGIAPPFRVFYGSMDTETEVSGYDGNGNLTRVTDSLGGELRLEYDRLNLPRVLQHQATDGLTSDKRMELEFNRLGKIIGATRYASLDDSIPVVESTYEYTCAGCSNALSRILQTRIGTGETIRDTNYARNPIGWIESMLDADSSVGYSLDSLGQLGAANGVLNSEAHAESYDHDSVGNRTLSHSGGTYTYETLPGGTPGRLLATGAHSYQYDAEGNLRRKVNLSTGEVLELDVDHRRRVRQVRVLDSQNVEIARESYSYDPADRLIRVDGPGGTRYIMYDGLNPIVELDGGGTVVLRRMYDRALDSVLAEDSTNGSVWLLKDNVLSVMDSVQNSASAGVVGEWRYDSFGSQLSGGTNSLESMRFQSRPVSSVSGLGYFRGRWYEPETGRFTAEDLYLPYGYTFGANNPTIGMDPRGASVLVEYACLASAAVGQAKPIIDYATSVANLYTVIAEIVDSPTPENLGRIDSALGDLGLGIAGLFPSPPSGAGGLSTFAFDTFCSTSPGARSRVDSHYRNLRSDIRAKTADPSDIRNWNRGGWWGYTSGPGRNMIHIR